MKKWMVTIAMFTVMLIAPVAHAHEGHAHKVMGTVSSIDGKNIMVKTTDGKTVTVMLDGKTKITQGKNKVDVSAMKVGERLVAEGPEKNSVMTATTIRLGEATPATAKK